MAVPLEFVPARAGGGTGGRVALTALGCRVNQAEMDELAARFHAVGYRVVPPEGDADVYVLNTCTVTHVADQKSRQLVRRLRRRSPNATIVVTGCYAERAPAEVAGVDGVDLVVTNRDKERILERVLEHRGQPAVEAPHVVPEYVMGSRTRAMIKVQDGCNHFCAYCIIPFTRGSQRSVPVDRVVAQIEAKIAAGYREAVLTGIHIGAYGRDADPDARRDPNRDRTDLRGLIRAILDRTPIERLRLSSIEPEDFDERFLDLWSDPRLCRHLHLCLQVGTDTLLKSMGRHYDTARYRTMVERTRRALPGVAVTSDVIVGLPGETDVEFERGLAFIEEMDFADLHVFRYSKRTGTRAATMPGHVPTAVVDERSARLHELAARQRDRFRRRWLGDTLTVLFEQAEDSSGIALGGTTWSGLTDNYLRVYARAREPLGNTFRAVELLDVHEDGVAGRLAPA